MQILAVDWSGARGAAETIWLARVLDGRLAELENGRRRDEVVARVVELARRETHTVVGLDFAFSFPRWWCETNGWGSGPDVWRAMRDQASGILEGCAAPFWGRAGTKALSADRALRETDRAARPAKSVFQIGGAGAVGTGSLRGMPYLAELRASGFSIWPFDPPGWPRVVEIYPRLLTGAVTKSKHRCRLEHLTGRFADQDRQLLERAAGSEDAFDAAVSALVMAEHAPELAGLPPARAETERIEGRIWRPADPAPTA